MPAPLPAKNCIAGLKSILGDSALLSPSTRAIIENTIMHLENYDKVREEASIPQVKTVRWMKGNEILAVWNLEDPGMKELMNREIVDFQITLS